MRLLPLLAAPLAAPLFAVQLFAIMACDPRVEEPSLEAKPLAKPAVTCPVPTPDKPKREVKGPVPDPRCPADPETPPKLDLAVVRFPDHPNLEVGVELAVKNEHRMRGLMYRKSMAESAGMLFVFEGEEPHSFWMRNTCIPLDMLFIAADGTIVGIEENTPTMSEESMGPPCPAKYVLEVNAGYTRKHGIKSGQKVTLPG